MLSRRRIGRGRPRTRMLLVGGFLLAGLMAPVVVSAIHVVTTSTPTLTVRDPAVRVESGGVSGCSVTVNANGTGAVLDVTGTSTGATYSECWRLNNIGETEYQFMIRYVSGSNLDRLTTLKVMTKDGAINLDHVVIENGVVTQTESPAWIKIPKPGKKPLDVQQKVTSGDVSTVHVEALVAKGTQTRVYALYDVTLHVSAT